jgi:hypothetical protein
MVGICCPLTKLLTFERFTLTELSRPLPADSWQMCSPALGEAVAALV